VSQLQFQAILAIRRRRSYVCKGTRCQAVLWANARPVTEVTKRNVQSLIGNNTLASLANWADSNHEPRGVSNKVFSQEMRKKGYDDAKPIWRDGPRQRLLFQQHGADRDAAAGRPVGISVSAVPAGRVYGAGDPLLRAG